MRVLARDLQLCHSNWFLVSFRRGSMALHRVVSGVSLLATRRLSRMRPSSALAMFVCLAGFLILTVYESCVAFVLIPLAKLLFRSSSRVASKDVTRSIWDPAIASTFVIGAAQMNRTAEILLRQKHVSYAALPFRRPEVDIILSQLRPSDILLEFGASGTTLSFPYFTNHTYSVEHDEQVCSAISDEIHMRHMDITDKVDSFCVTVPQWIPKTSPLEEGNYNIFKQYVDFPRNNLSRVLFDRVLINGRARVACALRILPQLKTTSLVFFHDFFLRPAHYSTVLQYYDEVARVVAHRDLSGDQPHYTDEPMGLLVLKPKGQYVGLSDHDDIDVSKVNAIYETYVEQPPSTESTGIGMAIKYGLADSTQGGFPYYEMSRSLSRQTTEARLLLDLVALPFVALAVYLVYALFNTFFRDPIARISNSKYTLPVSREFEKEHSRPEVSIPKLSDSSSEEFVGNTRIIYSMLRSTKAMTEGKSE